MIHGNVGGHIACAAFKNSLRGREWRTAMPAPYSPRVARAGCVAFSERACHVESISICPVGAALRFRKDKSIAYEGARLEIEFTDHSGVSATARKGDEAAVMIGRQSGAAVPDPVLAFIASKRVD